MTAITWKIVNLDRYTADGLVYCVHWTATAVDGDFGASIVNTQTLERGDSFVSYNTLTEETVLGWLWSKIDKAAVEDVLTAHIEAQKAPVTANGLPWSVEA